MRAVMVLYTHGNAVAATAILLAANGGSVSKRRGCLTAIRGLHNAEIAAGLRT